jgi:ribosomal protein L10
MESKREKEIPGYKLKQVKDLENLIRTNKTFMICSIKGLPGKQFQDIKKKLREHVKIKVIKKNLVLRAIDNAKIDGKVKEHIQESSALLFSDIELFELSGILSENTVPVGARIGQLAPEDIEIEPGPTELVPGPVISELGSLGLKIAIEDGKITIKEKKVIVKQGQPVNAAASSIMSKLGIKPFKIGFESIAAYDRDEKRVYINIKINKEETLVDLKYAYGKSLAFAVKLAYACRSTIGFLLAKAASHEKALASLVKSDSSQTVEVSQSPPQEEIKQE